MIKLADATLKMGFIPSGVQDNITKETKKIISKDLKDPEVQVDHVSTNFTYFDHDASHKQPTEVKVSFHRTATSSSDPSVQQWDGAEHE
eukprot:1222485-Ditylum_brightwellii.AAC.1